MGRGSCQSIQHVHGHGRVLWGLYLLNGKTRAEPVPVLETGWRRVLMRHEVGIVPACRRRAALRSAAFLIIFHPPQGLSGDTVFMTKSVSILLLFTGIAVTLTSPSSGQDLSGRIQQVRDRLERDRYAGSAEHLGRLLYTDCEVRMDEAPIEDAVAWLAAATGAPLRILGDRKGQPGIDPSVEITLDVRGMPALTVLEIMMEQYEDETSEACDWQLRTGRVEISTKERLARKSAQRLKRYPIQDLITDVPNFDNGPRLDLGTALAQGSQQGGGNGSPSLFQGGSDDPDLPSAAEKAEQIIELIVELVESEGWARNGGDWASIRYHEGNLLIKAPDFVHRRVGGYPFRPARAVGPASIKKSDGQGPRGARYTEGRTEIPGSGTWEAKLPERSPAKTKTIPSSGNPMPRGD